MKKLIKIAIVFAALVILLFVAALGIAVWKIDPLAKAGVERGATYALGVQTTLESIHIGLLTGSCDLDNLRVANPPGFESKEFLALKDGSVAVKLGSLRSNTVEIPYLRLSGVEVYLQQTRDSANYQVILDNIEKVRGKPKPAPTEGQPETKGYLIKEVVVNDITAHVTTAKFGKTDVTVKIPEIKLKNVGSGTDYGAQLSEVTDIIVRAILLAVAKKGLDILPTDLLKDLELNLDDIGSLGDLGFEVSGDAVKIIEGLGGSAGEIGKTILDPDKKLDEKASEVTKEVGKSVGESGEKAIEGAGKVLKGVGDILGGKKEEEKKPEK